MMKVSEKLDRESNRDYAYRIIHHNIINLELKPGSMLSEQDLADELELSRTPVHEALQELSKTKIIEVFPQKGSLVSLIDMKLVNEARFVRVALESQITELACQAATASDIQKLEENINLQEFYINKQVQDKIMELDDEFHRMMYQITDKMQTYLMVKNMNIHYDRFRELKLHTSIATPLLDDHKEILNAIISKNGAAAKELVINHLSRINADEKEIRKKYGEFFK
ncbi:MAG: GntR family transcriptional regulator [Spirochaetia bacterium]|nr:GntR family transcriptional regulator [Spirochaetia bacterium]MDD7269468.1 GntR family transcriptional regulator [Treponema sp.]MDY4984966.1 GntR family transcriptional regulator [Treponema sp.]